MPSLGNCEIINLSIYENKPRKSVLENVLGLCLITKIKYYIQFSKMFHIKLCNIMNASLYVFYSIFYYV